MANINYSDGKGPVLATSNSRGDYASGSPGSQNHPDVVKALQGEKAAYVKRKEAEKRNNLPCSPESESKVYVLMGVFFVITSFLVFYFSGNEWATWNLVIAGMFIGCSLCQFRFFAVVFAVVGGVITMGGVCAWLSKYIHLF